MEALADLLSLIVQPCYDLTGNWWAAIALFTLIIKVVLMPMALWVQQNSIVMVKLMPALNRIKVRYFGDAEAIGERQSALFKERRYHPMLSLIPLAIQIVILFGLVDVIHRITDQGAPGTELLGLIPVEDGGLTWAWPIIAGLSAVALGFAQNRINPLQREQSRSEKNTTNGLSIALSFFLGMFVAAGMAFYWVCSNLMAILVQVLCNLIIDPRKQIDYDELAESRAELDGLNALSADRPKWYRRDMLSKREKADFKRFFATTGKHIVLYSVGSGLYNYVRGAIVWLLGHSNARIHYVTNDPNDQVFQLAEREPRLFPYFIGEKKAITLMMKMDADVVVTTLGDLDNFYIKRSYVRSDIEYVYMFHHMTSMDMTSTVGEYDHYDTLLCTGPHQLSEMRRIEGLRGLPAKRLVECGYDLLDRELADYAQNKEAINAGKDRPLILLAPSWQEDNLLDSCVDELLGGLLGKGYRIVVRPHPEFIKRYRARLDALLARYAHVPADELSFECDFSTHSSILAADVLVTDWSSVFCEFCFTTLRPAVFIDTTPKVRNPNWRDYGIDSTDISLRNRVGRSLKMDELDRFAATVADMLAQREQWRERIHGIREGFVFNLGSGGAAAGEYLLATMLEKQRLRKAKGTKGAKDTEGASDAEGALRADAAQGQSAEASCDAPAARVAEGANPQADPTPEAPADRKEAAHDRA